MMFTEFVTDSRDAARNGASGDRQGGEDGSSIAGRILAPGIADSFSLTAVSQ